jgi:hypothetical protein
LALCGIELDNNILQDLWLVAADLHSSLKWYYSGATRRVLLMRIVGRKHLDIHFEKEEHFLDYH